MEGSNISTGGVALAAGAGALIGSWFSNGWLGGNGNGGVARVAEGGCGCSCAVNAGYNQGRTEGQILCGMDFTAQGVNGIRNDVTSGFANMSNAQCNQTRDILSAITQSEVNTLNRELNKANSEIFAAQTQNAIMASQRATDSQLCALGTQTAVINQNLGCLSQTVNSLIYPAEVRCHRPCGSGPTL